MEEKVFFLQTNSWLKFDGRSIFMEIFRGPSLTGNIFQYPIINFLVHLPISSIGWFFKGSNDLWGLAWIWIRESGIQTEKGNMLEEREAKKVMVFNSLFLYRLFELVQSLRLFFIVFCLKLSRLFKVSDPFVVFICPCFYIL